MSNQKSNSADAVYMNNLSVVSAALELGSAAVQKVMGDDAISNQIQGETQSGRDIQELIAARLTKRFVV